MLPSLFPMALMNPLAINWLCTENIRNNHKGDSTQVGWWPKCKDLSFKYTAENKHLISNIPKHYFEIVSAWDIRQEEWG